jgi:DNA-directed RNA polymerase specialized sigma24 family protein
MAIDAAELGRVIESHQRMVFSIALRLTGDYGLAEEVAQDVFLDFFRSAEKLTGKEHVRFWLVMVLRYQEDMVPGEIAELLGHPVATVKSHLQRGLQLLRKKAAVTMKEYIR